MGRWFKSNRGYCVSLVLSKSYDDARLSRFDDSRQKVPKTVTSGRVLMSIKRHLLPVPTLKTPDIRLAGDTDSRTGFGSFGNFSHCLRRVADFAAGRNCGRSAVSRPRWADVAAQNRFVGAVPRRQDQTISLRALSTRTRIFLWAGLTG